MALESRDDFRKPCPRCGGVMGDHTSIDQDGGECFFRVRFSCPACRYWLCTRRESFNTLGPSRDERAAELPLPPEVDQRVRLDLTHLVLRELMPGEVEAYEFGKVWTAEPGKVAKSESQVAVAGLHLWLTTLASNYLERGDRALGLRACELAVETLRNADPHDPNMAADEPQNRRNAAIVLVNLASLYHQEGRESEAEGALTEAVAWAPELFEE